MTNYQKIKEAVDYIHAHVSIRPTIGLVLGSGLGGYADTLEDAVRIPYSEIPNFPSSTVESHAGKMIIGKLSGKDVLIVEDILDTGVTLSNLVPMLKLRNPLSLKVITLLDKPSRRLVDFKADLSLFTIPDHFVIGYGLDCAEAYRNLPYIAEYGESADE